jgi:hypothetical protein
VLHPLEGLCSVAFQRFGSLGSSIVSAGFTCTAGGTSAGAATRAGDLWSGFWWMETADCEVRLGAVRIAAGVGRATACRGLARGCGSPTALAAGIPARDAERSSDGTESEALKERARYGAKSGRDLNRGAGDRSIRALTIAADPPSATGGLGSRGEAAGDGEVVESRTRAGDAAGVADGRASDAASAGLNSAAGTTPPPLADGIDGREIRGTPGGTKSTSNTVSQSRCRVAARQGTSLQIAATTSAKGMATRAFRQSTSVESRDQSMHADSVVGQSLASRRSINC